MEGSSNERLDFGKMGYGCKHYRRRCRIRAPCCNEIFPCRHCHNEAASMLSRIADRHELNRHEVKQVICAICDTEQPVAKVCTNCGINMGDYFCETCKFYDDDIYKQQFHCDDCGICRVGGHENFFHCKKCGSCYSVHLRNNHSCVENAMRHHCPICYEFLFDSLKDTTIMKCGHTMHHECYYEMIKHDRFCCPICSKSVRDMSKTWKRIDEEIEATIMPEEYRYKKASTPMVGFLGTVITWDWFFLVFDRSNLNCYIPTLVINGSPAGFNMSNFVFDKGKISLSLTLEDKGHFNGWAMLQVKLDDQGTSNIFGADITL